jgi:hypothetical protein
LKLLEKKIGKILEDVNTDNAFLNKNSIAQEIRARIDKWDCINLKNSSLQKKQ